MDILNGLRALALNAWDKLQDLWYDYKWYGFVLGLGFAAGLFVRLNF